MAVVAGFMEFLCHCSASEQSKDIEMHNFDFLTAKKDNSSAIFYFLIHNLWSSVSVLASLKLWLEISSSVVEFITCSEFQLILLIVAA